MLTQDEVDFLGPEGLEKIGLDISEHGIEAYPDYAMSTK